MKHGPLEASFKDLIGGKIAGSCCSRRLRQVDNDLLQSINQTILRPLAEPGSSPDSFWKGWRLTGIDGTAFLLQNTAQILSRVPKAQVGKHGSKKPSQPKGRRKEVAEHESDRDGGDKVGFPRVFACALVELGTHAPLGVQLGLQGEGELTLAGQLIDTLQEGMLVLGDKLYGRAAFVHALLGRCQAVKAAFMIKMPSGQTSKLLERLEDGSSLVEVKLRSKKRPATIESTFIVREIRYTISTIDEEGRPVEHECRVWTDLLDPVRYPAPELAGVMSHRWEHEVYYKEVKSLCPHHYLDSQLLETAAVEIMALIWVSALLARARSQVAAEEERAEISISFSKTHDTLQKLLWLVMIGVGILTPEQIEHLAREAFTNLQQSINPPRRNRCCPRKVRRKQKQWPRLRRRCQSRPQPTILICPPSMEGI